MISKELEKLLAIPMSKSFGGKIHISLFVNDIWLYECKQ